MEAVLPGVRRRAPAIDGSDNPLCSGRPAGRGERGPWARKLVHHDSRAIVFDAILVKESEREPLLRAARAYPISTIAVWFRTPLEACLTRNAARPKDEVVPERAVRNVHAAVEPPTMEEGFHRIIEVFPNVAEE